MTQSSSDRRRQADLERGRMAAAQERVVARDAGLDLIGRTTRWLVAGAVGVTGAISLYASHAFRPHPAAAAPALSGSASAPTSVSRSPAQTGASGLAAAPAAPVAAAPSAPAVISGGS
jgi:hypothetical protein